MLIKHLQTIAHGLILTSIMLALIAAALWLKSGPVEPAAQAQTIISENPFRTRAADPPVSGTQPRGGVSGGGVPDSGAQRIETIEQLQEINRHLADIEKGLRSGAYTIQVPESKAAAAARAAKGE